MKTLWIARDKTGSLWVYKRKPERIDKCFDIEYGVHERMYLDCEDFPEVTWENSPQQVELKMKFDADTTGE